MALRRCPSFDPNLFVKVFDFFSGCGGASQGFRDAGMEIVFALDKDMDAKRTFTKNFPNATFLSEDIRQVEAKDTQLLVNQAHPNPILFCGCAPCQPFTKQNTIRPQSDKDERIPLILEFLRLIQGCNPDIVFLENVPGIQKVSLNMNPLNRFIDGLRCAGYQIDCASVYLKKYGVPQSRQRFLLIASRHGRIKLPPQTHGPGTPNPKFSTVRDWIGRLPELSAGETHSEVPNHRSAGLSELNLKRIQATPEGGGNLDWPPHLRLRCHLNKVGYSDVYGRMSWDRPAPGLTTRCISYSNGRFGHPEQDRAISVREAASLQTFPMDFVFTGNLHSMARQIGNAVPVKLATIIGHQIVRHLNEIGKQV